MSQYVRKYVKHFVALILIAAVYWAARLPTISKEERAELAGGFQFTRFTLAEFPELPSRTVREVHPDLDHISSWISSVGAAASLADIDGDGLANDVCYVDTRIDQVIVSPVPTSTPRYKPFLLGRSLKRYDSKTTAPTGCVPGDLNEDGLIDILVYFWGRPPIAFLRKPEAANNSENLASQSFSPCEIESSEKRWFTNAATRADVDGDGHIDLIIGNYFPDGSRILDASAQNQEYMQDSMSRAFNGGLSRVLLWSGGTSGSNPTVSYQEIDNLFSDEVAHGWTLAIAAGDLDGDLLPELYFANDFGPDRLLYNLSVPGKPRFSLVHGRRGLTTPRSKVIGHDSFKGMGAEFADLNGDGLLDIYVSNIASEFALEESHFAFVCNGQLEQLKMGIAPFTERSEALGLARSGWGWDCRFADFNNDGVLEAVQATGFVKGEKNRWPELHEIAMGNDELLKHPRSWHLFRPGDDLNGRQHNPFFVRANDGKFHDLAGELDLNEPQVTRAIAIADTDGDGDLDLAFGNQWESSIFYRNDCPQPGTFLGLRLMLALQEEPLKTTVLAGHPRMASKARPAIGATAYVFLDNGRKLIGQVDGGNGHSGTRSPELHFGLEDHPKNVELRVELHWRSTKGDLHKDSIQIKPGWHTILLGNN